MKIICVFLVLYAVSMHKMKIHHSTTKPIRLLFLHRITTFLASSWSGYPPSKRAGAAAYDKHTENWETQMPPPQNTHFPLEYGEQPGDVQRDRGPQAQRPAVMDGLSPP